MPDSGPPLRRSPPPHFHDPRPPPRGDDRFGGPRGYFDDPRVPPPPRAGPYDERDRWYHRDPDPVRRTWPPDRHPSEPRWRDSPPPPGFREPGFREPRRDPYRDYPPEPDYPPLRNGPGYGGGPPLRPDEYDPPPPPMARLPPPAREVRLVSNGARPHQPHMFAPAPLPETARRELLDPPTDGYNPYGRRLLEEEEAVPQRRHGMSNVRTPVCVHRTRNSVWAMNVSTCPPIKLHGAAFGTGFYCVWSCQVLSV